MPLRKCVKCGVFFGAEGDEELCAKCKAPAAKKVVITGDVEHDKFTNARSLVYEKPHISPEELVKEMADIGIVIKIKEILRYVNEGRLALVSEDGGAYCSNCGKKIMIGSMCATCTDKLEVFRNCAQKVVKQVDGKLKVGMHTSRK